MKQPVEISTHSSIQEIDPIAWDALVDSPFLEHRFLLLLEDAECVGGDTGWIPAYITAKQNDELVGALPLFLKTHSAGEFVFDWGWADAAERAGISYFPKGVVAAPLTPVTGSRLLTNGNDELRGALVQGALEVANAIGLSSMHFNFISNHEKSIFESIGLPIRVGTQYHWMNERSEDGGQFESFDQFLGEFRSKRRANIRRERKKLKEQNVTTEVKVGDDITNDDLDRMFRYYKNTIDKFYWGKQYLNREFFMRTADRFRDRLHLVVASKDGSPFAGTFNLYRDDRLYGRYWGCSEDVNYAHFELCMYTPISWCIEQNIQVFEPGAGGEHKFERGFRPTFTYSSHFVRHPALFDAVQHAIQDERAAIEHYRDRLRDESPLKVPGF